MNRNKLFVYAVEILAVLSIPVIAYGYVLCLDLMLN